MLIRTPHIITIALGLSLGGCATPEWAEEQAELISDECKNHAAHAEKKGHRPLQAYAQCMDLSLQYLQARAEAKRQR